MKGLIVWIGVLIGTAVPAFAQDQDRSKDPLLQQLLKEMKELREENKQLRADVDALKKIDAQRESAAQPQESPQKGNEVLDKVFQEKKPVESGKRSVDSMYDEGFWFVADDDRMRILGWTQEDLRAFDHGYPGADTFLNRRTRIGAVGTLENNFNYMIMLGLERSTDPIQFAYVEYAQYPWMKFRVGQFKEPYSLEELTSDLYTDLLERSIMIPNFSPAQDLGAMVHGVILDNHLEYALGAFNGRGKNKEDNTDDKDLAARVVVAPFKAGDTDVLKGLSLGVSGTYGREDETLGDTSLKTAGQSKFWTYTTGVVQADVRTRFGMDLEWLFGPASIKTEWNRVSVDNVELGAVGDDAVFEGWYVSGTYLLTGEKKTRGNKPVSPTKIFDMDKGTWGAFELAVRYEQFDAESDLIDLGVATGTDHVDAYALGVNWTLNRHVRTGIMFQRSEFDDPVTMSGQTRDNEDLYLMRFQFEF